MGSSVRIRDACPALGANEGMAYNGAHDMETTSCLPHRKVTRRGLLMRVCSVRPREHAGGGRRGRQSGHGRKAARAMHDFLLGCHAPALAVWLTFPSVLGPKTAKKHVDSFLGRLERRLRHKFGVVVKMELQARLAPEFCLLVWGVTPEEMPEDMAAELWKKSIKAEGRIRIDTSSDWAKLAGYVSKEIAVRDYQVFIGGKPSARMDDAGYTDDLSKEHKTNEFFPLPAMPYRMIHQYREWETYTGHYWWKRGLEFIPRYRELETYVPADTVAPFQHAVNAHRVRFFVGAGDGFSIKGGDAARAAAALSPALMYADERDSPKPDSPKPADMHPAAGQSPLCIPLSGGPCNDGISRNPASCAQATHANSRHHVGYYGIGAGGGENMRQFPQARHYWPRSPAGRHSAPGSP